MKMAEENKENKNLDEEVIEESIDEVVNQCEEPVEAEESTENKELAEAKAKAE